MYSPLGTPRAQRDIKKKKLCVLGVLCGEFKQRDGITVRRG